MGISRSERPTKLQTAEARPELAARLNGAVAFGTLAYHREAAIKSLRALLDSGLVIEDCLDVALEAARREFGVRIVVAEPCRLLVDGGLFVWPTSTTSRAPERTNGTSRHA